MPALPYFKFFVNDWLGDTLKLGEAERGAYINILAAMWNADGFLTPEQARRAAGTDPRKWPARWAALASYFVVGADGRISNKRLKTELGKASHISGVRAEAARGDTQNVHPQTVTNSVTPGDANHLKNQVEDAAIAPQRARVQSPEPELEAATPSAPQPPRAEDWPEVPPGRMHEVFAMAVGSPKLDPSKNVSPKFHAEAPGYLRRWRDAGCSWLADVLPVAIARVAVADGPIHTLKYFDFHVLHAHAARTAPFDPATHRGGRRADKLADKDANSGASVAGSELAHELRNSGRGGGFFSD